MNFTLKSGTLTIFLEGRIDTTNSDEVASEIDGIISENPSESTVLDAEKLEYISSAGLRIVLKLRKADANLRITNASTEVYEIFDMTGFTEMIKIEKAYRRLSVDGCEVIGSGAKGVVYRFDRETIVKVYKNPDSLPDIQKERNLARKAFILGIPTAISYDIAKVGNSYGSVFELLDASSFSSIIAKNDSNTDEYVKKCTDLLRKIHQTEVNPSDMPNAKATVLDWLDVASRMLDGDTKEKLASLIDALPDRRTMIHGDYHTNNIMMQNGETLLIDMDTLSYGHPVIELANIHITYVGFGEYDQKMVERFIGLPYDKSIEIWNKFLPMYLGTDDSEKIAEIENKIIILSYTRLMRHFIRRGADNSSDVKKLMEFCAGEIARRIKDVDTLEF